jgi:hypothetical protein
MTLRKKPESKPELQLKCFVEVCDGTNIAARGLCTKCYPTGRYLIRTGKATWTELEMMGLAKPKKSFNASPLFDSFMQQKQAEAEVKRIATKTTAKRERSRK